VSARTAQCLLAALVWLPTLALGYPLDGYEDTGIRRVEGSRRGHEGLAQGGFQPPGALLPTDAVDLRLLDHRELGLPPADPELTAAIVTLLGEQTEQYGMALLDLTDPTHPVYAEHRGDHPQNVGSVGKILVALGLFQGLADTWPADTTLRAQVLRDSMISADGFAHSDSHTIRLFNPATNELIRRPMEDGDRGSLWEYLDWMLSVSSNSAASMVMRDAMILRQFGQQYPLSEPAVQAFFASTSAAELTRLFQRTFLDPVTRNGFDLGNLRQGSFFTAQGKRYVNGGASSYATARSLVEFMLRLEQGRVVDEWSSRQIKRLLYVTELRVRYASAPALRKAAVYYKSGSLYKCRQEPGFRCGKYMGNVLNYMNSVIIVEQEVAGVKLHYIAAVVSNVLRKNSAEEHQAIGTAVHQLIEARHEVTD